MMHRSSLITTALLTASVLASGCGPGRPVVVPVSGTVTVGGKPVAGATVLFQPTGGGVPGRGVTGEDGGFTLTTFEQGDGAIVGRHRVAVSKMTMSGVVAAEGDVAPAVVSTQVRETWATPPRYASVETSGLEIDVARGMAPISLALEGK